MLTEPVAVSVIDALGVAERDRDADVVAVALIDDVTLGEAVPDKLGDAEDVSNNDSLGVADKEDVQESVTDTVTLELGVPEQDWDCD